MKRSAHPAQEARRAAGTCTHCARPPKKGRTRCGVHLKQERDKATDRRRARGQLTEEEYRRRQRAGEYQQQINVAGRAVEERLTAAGRCQVRGCGLLLPCYGKHRIDEYAAERLEGNCPS